ncbi:tyrosine-type recombinase/integrase [Leuconostoc citreum]|uniref:site-specific integrase n=1 Tax=Leuconostoc citreum TaxID=33964 RepID=UPI00188943E0|nr:site-specific integrase [Leuconostoc citreum]QOY97093.1 tyrosine-type recombinase/integrase [Leuconostoc citreum]
MASIYKRGKTWTANVSIMQDKKRIRKTMSGFLTKRDATSWANDIEVQKQNDVLVIQDPVFTTAFEEWYLIFKEPQLETSTKQWYKRTLSLLQEKWANKKMSEIASKDFQKLINDYGSDHVLSSVSHIKNITSAFVRYALDEDMVKKDFTRNVKTHSVVKSKDKQLKFLEVEDMEKLIHSVKDNDAVTSKMILTAVYSGMRFSEVAGLTRNDFDFDNNIISVNKSWQIHDQKFKDTKTQTSNRDLTMPQVYMDIAKKWHFGKTFAFESENGTPPSDNAANKQLKRYLEKNNSKIITFHGLRHTHASYLLANDVAIQFVSERLGHADVNITLSTYAHLLNKKRTEETDKMLSLLNKV